MRTGTASRPCSPCVRDGMAGGVSIGQPGRCIKYKGYSRVVYLESVQWMQSDGMGCFGCVGTKSPFCR